MRSYYPFIALFLITTSSALVASGAVVSGVAIRWDTLAPLPDTIIRIYQNNDLIQQVKCDGNGTYSVNLTPDRYHLAAASIENGTVAYVSELNMTISESGAHIDIPMFPPFEELFPDVEEFVSIYNQIELLSAINESEYNNKDNISSYILKNGTKTQSKTGTTEIIKKYNYIFIPLLLFIVVIVLTAYFLKSASSMNKKINADSDTIEMVADYPETETDNKDKIQDEIIPFPDMSVQVDDGLSDDEHTILRVLEDAGGSIQQKQLVKEMECSPAKVSLLLKGLEEKGLVKKQTIGRTNLVKLT